MAARTVSEEEIALTKKILGQLAVVIFVLAVPYVIVGLFWADAHSDHLAYMHGPDKLFSWAGEVVAWPVLIFADLELK